MTDLIPAPRPVPTREDRMRDARQPGPTFATYLDRHERDQLDARAATAEQERDDALDDRDQVRRELNEAMSILAKIGDAISPTGERPEEALGTLAADVESVVEARDHWRCELDKLHEAYGRATTEREQARADLQQLRSRYDLARQQRDEALEARDVLRAQLDQARAELADAQELLAVVDDITEQLDRARARYATRQQEQGTDRLGSPEARAQDEPAEG